MMAFQEWAYWVITNPLPSWPLGFKSGSIEQSILEGKGKILPSAPRKSGRPSVRYNNRIKAVDDFLKGRERKIILVFLVYDGTYEQKAKFLKISRRQMMRQVSEIYSKFVDSTVGSLPNPPEKW